MSRLQLRAPNLDARTDDPVLTVARIDRFYALWVLVATTGMRHSETVRSAPRQGSTGLESREGAHDLHPRRRGQHGP